MSSRLIKLLVLWAMLTSVLEFVAARQTDISRDRAILSMAVGLALVWIVGFGLITLRFRDRIRQRVLLIKLDWCVKFVLFATALALIEEAITTTLSNLAPLFGVRLGEAYITASANYLDVILFHSVIVFIPMYIAWAWLLKRYRFSPNAVFLLYGLTGTFSEIFSFGTQNLLALGFWVCVYGLMIYLPAYSLPPDYDANRPRPLHYLLALVLPFLMAIPVALVAGALHPAGGDFPPISP